MLRRPVPELTPSSPVWEVRFSDMVRTLVRVGVMFLLSVPPSLVRALLFADWESASRLQQEVRAP